MPGDRNPAELLRMPRDSRSTFSDLKGSSNRPTIRVFVATTVLLTFISFWRAAAIVLSDLGSSAYYVGGDAEKVIGKSAPWFILAVMLFANCVRARRGISRSPAGHGRNAGEIFGLGVDVRLHSDRPDQRRFRRTIPNGLAE